MTDCPICNNIYSETRTHCPACGAYAGWFDWQELRKGHEIRIVVAHGAERARQCPESPRFLNAQSCDCES